MIERRDIEQLGRTIAERFKPERVILFGSYAYGTPTRDSDVDLLVVMNHEGSAPRKAAEIRLSLPAHVPLDVIVRSPERLHERLAMNDSFMREIIERGRPLYESKAA